ncbi:hypothetical protein K488DRAFT_84703 [Vararia minispora EC-137]|uniref:Uncharacterized protein n=1 Tax=Vararia minispora EC-137 TaxID=1314806 RepID=A0ACB8QPY2_9AGAM|nr:hypothetical protein K488DRAFT_84703 [Vararia minispora EC-137]
MNAPAPSPPHSLADIRDLPAIAVAIFIVPACFILAFVAEVVYFNNRERWHKRPAPAPAPAPANPVPPFPRPCKRGSMNITRWQHLLTATRSLSDARHKDALARLESGDPRAPLPLALPSPPSPARVRPFSRPLSFALPPFSAARQPSMRPFSLTRPPSMRPFSFTRPLSSPFSVASRPSRASLDRADKCASFAGEYAFDAVYGPHASCDYDHDLDEKAVYDARPLSDRDFNHAFSLALDAPPDADAVVAVGSPPRYPSRFAFV